MRNANFDIALIVGVLLLAIGSASITLIWPQPWVFFLVLSIDLWLLGYPHVVATFTRIAFDTDSFRSNRFLVLWLPLIVAAVTITGMLAVGPWLVASPYLFWQWFHYTRQSYGVARSYQVKVDRTSKSADLGIIYLVPLAGILHRCYQAPATFLGSELKVPYVPLWLFLAVSALALVAILHFLHRQVIAYRGGTFSLGYSLFMLSHIIIFVVSYIVIKDINRGWLALNIWHNTQYLMFVWMFNNRRFKDASDPKAKLLSFISKKSNVIYFVGVILGISSIFYFSTTSALKWWMSNAGLNQWIDFTALPLTVVFFQAINFHHYIVDGIIWKVRKKAVSDTIVGGDGTDIKAAQTPVH